MSIVSAKPAGTTFFNCNKEEMERNNRRAQFEKSRNKTISVIGINASSELKSFSMGVARMIEEFKKSKRN